MVGVGEWQGMEEKQCWVPVVGPGTVDAKQMLSVPLPNPFILE